MTVCLTAKIYIDDSKNVFQTMKDIRLDFLELMPEDYWIKDVSLKYVPDKRCFSFKTEDVVDNWQNS